MALQRPNSRQDEFEADQKGLLTLGRAGYAQSAMIAFMQKLLKQPSVPTFLSTHPATSDRIAALKPEINSQKSSDVGGGLNHATYEARIQPLISYIGINHHVYISALCPEPPGGLSSLRNI